MPITPDEAAARARRNVPDNPHPLCRDFQAQAGASAYWCAVCHWNEHMHGDETYRTAIADALEQLNRSRAGNPMPVRTAENGTEAVSEKEKL